MKDKTTILVTWDFTPVSENAFMHAVKIARSIDNSIRLLHVVKPDGPEKLKGAEEKMKEEVFRLRDQYGISVESVILKGSIFNQISEYTKDHEDISMVVMGTHGLKGKQKFFGSYALRVIIGSPVPFIVVQDKPENMDKLSDIVFPIDFKSENKEKLQWAIFLGKYFGAKVHLFKSPISDKSLAKKINTNLNFAIRFLIHNNLDYANHTADKSGNFMKATLTFAKAIKADIVLITTTKHITFLDYLFGASEQYVISNPSRIPAMVVNPKATFAKVGQFMYGNT